MNNFGDLPWTGFEPGTSGFQSDTLPLSQRCSEETDEFSLQYFSHHIIIPIIDYSELEEQKLSSLNKWGSVLNST